MEIVLNAFVSLSEYRISMFVEAELHDGDLSDLEEHLNLVSKGVYHPDFTLAVDKALNLFFDQIPEHDNIESMNAAFEGGSNEKLLQFGEYFYSDNHTNGHRIKCKPEYLRNLLEGLLLRGDWKKDFKTKRLYVDKEILF